VLKCVNFIFYTDELVFNSHSQVWTDDAYFKRVTLAHLGLRIQLGHNAREKCRNPVRTPGGDFVVVDVNGIHEVELDFCGCEMSKQPFIQLLRYGWFPASVDRPKSAATFSILKFFHILNFESKASSFEFHNTLARLTDNTGTSTHKVCDLASVCIHLS
jgi:hypothetical protein